jgi:hypothetical protein
VGTALGYGLDDRGSRVRFPAGAGTLSLHHRDLIDSAAHPASYPLVPGAPSLVVKRQVREADHLPPSSAQVKECVELYFHTPKYVFMAWCLVKHRDLNMGPSLLNSVY